MKKKVIVPTALLTAVLAAARYAILPLSPGRSSTRSFLVATALPLLCCSPALAQVGMLTPPLGATSSLGSVPGAPVGPNGLPPPGVSPEVSPVPNGVTGTINVPSTSSGTACSTVGISPSGLYGSTATYDGGGLPGGSTGATSGTATPGTSGSSGISTSSAISATSGVSTTSGMLDTSGLSGMCGSGSSSIAASSTPTTTSSPSTTTAGSARAGVPLGSYEIGNLGVSPSSALPTTSVLPITGSVGEFSAVGTDDARCFTLPDDKHHPLKQFFLCERERP